MFAAGCNRSSAAKSEVSQWLWYQANGCKPGVALLLTVQDGAIASAKFALIDPEPSSGDPLASSGYSEDVSALKSEAMSFDGKVTDPATGKPTDISVSDWKLTSDSEAQATIAIGPKDENAKAGKLDVVFVRRKG